jgi:DNA-nicking Smr family endonuclease
MSRRGGRSKPTSEELALWETVAKTVAPLRRRRSVKAKAEEEAKPAEPQRPDGKAAALPPGPLPDPKMTAAPPPVLASLDRRLRTRVARGAVAIDARIDLHGMTQSAAHARLGRFLAAAQADGKRIVLVITGKGKADAGDWREDRGVLRRMVPNWLAAPDMRTIVVGFEEAGRGHGGAGALYVHLRRRRDAGGDGR